MYSFPNKVLAVSMMAALAFSARAQQTIIFSKPADVSPDKANSFMQPSEHHSGDYNAPREFFKDNTPDPSLLPPPPPQNNDPSVKEALDKRRNWTLLTPEQILGIQTPEEFLHGQNKIHDGEKKLSLEEQFLLRQSRARTASASNSLAINAPWNRPESENPFALRTRDDENDPLHQSQKNMTPGSRYFNQLINADNPDAGPDGKPISPWGSAFAQSERNKATLEQQAAMERFRALMEPSVPPEKPVVTTRFSLPTATTPDPMIQAAAFVNPAGRAIEPLDNHYSKPTGITPLPAVSTPPSTPVTVRPSWQAQLPPWMTEGSQTHNPNRNF
jgi:hypothetical protein